MSLNLTASHSLTNWFTFKVQPMDNLKDRADKRSVTTYHAECFKNELFMLQIFALNQLPIDLRENT